MKLLICTKFFFTTFAVPIGSRFHGLFRGFSRFSENNFFLCLCTSLKEIYFHEKEPSFSLKLTAAQDGIFKWLNFFVSFTNDIKGLFLDWSGDLSRIIFPFFLLRLVTSLSFGVWSRLLDTGMLWLVFAEAISPSYLSESLSKRESYLESIKEIYQ